MFTEVGRYKIIEKIGQGGMAVVYLAEDPEIGRQVAIKIMNTQALQDDELRARFRQEAQTIAALDHPCIVPIYDSGEVDGAPYLVMRYMAGGTLDDWLHRGALPLPTIQEIMGRLARALDEAHRHDIIHRDLKPGNVLFDQRRVAFLSDFGIVKRLNASVNLTQPMGLIGTPAYMSPEQISGDTQLDGRSDIYSLGVVLFEMLTGQRPFQGQNTAALMHAHVYEPVPPLHRFNPNVPYGCQPIVDKAMAKKREQRFATAGDLVRALEPVAAGAPPMDYTPPTISVHLVPPPTPAPGLSTTERLKRQIKRLPVWARLLILSLGVIALATILFRVVADSPNNPTAVPTEISKPVIAGESADPLPTNPPPTNPPATATLPAGTLVLVDWDDSAIWQNGSGELARIPIDGLIPFVGAEPQTLQSNAAPLELILPDRTRLHLDANTTLQINHVAGVGEAPDTAVTLTNGRVVAQPSGPTLQIFVPPGFYAEAQTGIVGAEFDAALSHFAVDCLQDACSLVISANQRLDMAEGESRLVERDVLVNPGGARYERYMAWANAPLPTLTLTPAPDTATPGATPVLVATAPSASGSPGPRPSVVEIGQSVRGVALDAVRLGDGPRVFVLVGGIHAGYAPNTVQLANELIEYFRANPTAVPADVTLYIIPSLNPDAADATSRLAGRLNANGVDLNRNADCRWVADPVVLGSVTAGAGGTSPFSEPESQALRNFINQREPTAVLLLAAHGLDYGVASPGACINFSQVSVSLSKLYGRATGYRFPDSNNDGLVQADQSLTGDLTNWLDGIGVPAIAVLLPKYETTDFAVNLAGVTAVLNDYSGPESSENGAAAPTAVCGSASIVWPSVYEQHRAALGCAENQAQRPSSATQRYANGRMIWRSDTNEVYVLYDGGSMQTFVVATAVDYEQTNMLKGAFGQVWQTKPGVSMQLGEPQEVEYAINDMVAQDFDGGVMLNYTGSGGVYVLLTGQNHWELAQE